MAEEAGSKPATGREPEAVVATDALPKSAHALAEDAKDLKSLKTAVVDAVSVNGPLWLSYLFVLFYLAIAVGAVTHRDLLFEYGVKLPFLGIELPLAAFFVLGPAIFIVVHTYVLLHFVMLANKVGHFDRQ